VAELWQLRRKGQARRPYGRSVVARLWTPSGEL